MPVEMVFHCPCSIDEKSSIPLQLGNFFLKLQNKEKNLSSTQAEKTVYLTNEPLFFEN